MGKFIVLCKVMQMNFRNLLALFVLSTLVLTATSQVQCGERANNDDHKYLVWVRVSWYDSEGKLLEWEYGGGILVNERWILTAAHNLERDPTQVEVIAGTKDVTVEEDHVQEFGTIDMSSVIRHQEWIENKSPDHDIALIFFKEKHFNGFMTTAVVEPAKFIESDAPDVLRNTVVTIIGWGFRIQEADEEVDSASVAHKGNVRIIPNNFCEDLIGDVFNSEYRLCYGCTEGKCPQTTRGDSGGPVVNAEGVVVAVHTQ